MLENSKSEEIQFNLKDLLPHFEGLAEQYLGSPNMAALENIMSPVRDGSEDLSLAHIKAIRDEERKYWNFLWFWEIPEIEESKLASANKMLKKLKPRNRQLIKELYDIFKNIEVVSCILRFIDPENYAIISPPVENLLNIKGKDHVEKYINYLTDLRQLKDNYEFERMADVDMALWALARILNSHELRHKYPFKEFYDSYKHTYNLVKEIMAKNSFFSLFDEEPILVAELLSNSDHIVSGIMAGRLLELAIKKLAEENNIKLKVKMKHRDRDKTLSELLDELKLRKVIKERNCSELKECWDIRCRCVHEDEDNEKRSELPSQGEVKKMVRIIRKFLGKCKED